VPGSVYLSYATIVGPKLVSAFQSSLFFLFLSVGSLFCSLSVVRYFSVSLGCVRSLFFCTVLMSSESEFFGMCRWLLSSLSSLFSFRFVPDVLPSLLGFLGLGHSGACLLV